MKIVKKGNKIVVSGTKFEMSALAKKNKLVRAQVGDMKLPSFIKRVEEMYRSEFGSELPMSVKESLAVGIRDGLANDMADSGLDTGLDTGVSDLDSGVDMGDSGIDNSSIVDNDNLGDSLSPGVNNWDGVDSNTGGDISDEELLNQFASVKSKGKLTSVGNRSEFLDKLVKNMGK